MKIRFRTIKARAARNGFGMERPFPVYRLMCNAQNRREKVHEKVYAAAPCALRYRQLRLNEKGSSYENECNQIDVGAGECRHDLGTRVRRWAEVEHWEPTQRHVVAIS